MTCDGANGHSFSLYPLFTSSIHLFFISLTGDEITEHTGELHREDELGGGALAHFLERIEVLQRDRLLIDALGRFKDAGQRLAVTFSAQDGGPLVAFSFQDGSLFAAVGDVDG